MGQDTKRGMKEQNCLDLVKRGFFWRDDMPCEEPFGHRTILNATDDEFNNGLWQWLVNHECYKSCFGLLEDDRFEIASILRTAKPNERLSEFPDFIFQKGFIEHFQVTSSKTTRKGAEHKKDEQAFKSAVQKEQEEVRKQWEHEMECNTLRSTSRPQFLEKGEIQYSPAIIANIKPEFLPVDAEPTIGILVYSTAFSEIKVLNIPYMRILGYIGSRYQLLALGTERIKQIIAEKKQEWVKQKVEIGANAIDTLKSAISIMENRHEETALDELVLLLEVQSTFEENRLQICAYQSRIESTIPQIVTFVESLDTDGLNNYLEQILQITKPKYGGADYQIQKIFSGLNQYADEREQKWGLKQADAFYKSCGYKWVKIDVSQMGNEEIKLLVRIACEQEAQNKK